MVIVDSSNKVWDSGCDTVKSTFDNTKPYVTGLKFTSTGIANTHSITATVTETNHDSTYGKWSTTNKNVTITKSDLLVTYDSASKTISYTGGM